MQRIAIAVTAALLVAACVGPNGQLFQTTLRDISPSNPAGDLPMLVVLGDETGLVIGIEPGAGELFDLNPSVQADPGDPNAFVVSWLGGMCDNDAALSFRPQQAGYSLALTVHEKLGLGCPAAGIYRSVRVRTSKPISPDSIEAFGTG